MEEKIKISILLEIYANLLTKKQYTLLNDYYNNDLSLTEIAENENITRQAVRDFLKKGEKKLFEYEEKLKIMEKNKEQEEKISKILFELSQIEKNNSNKEIKTLLKKIETKLNSLI